MSHGACNLKTPTESVEEHPVICAVTDVLSFCGSAKLRAASPSCTNVCCTMENDQGLEFNTLVYEGDAALYVNFCKKAHLIRIECYHVSHCTTIFDLLQPLTAILVTSD